MKDERRLWVVEMDMGNSKPGPWKPVETACYWSRRGATRSRETHAASSPYDAFRVVCYIPKEPKP